MRSDQGHQLETRAAGPRDRAEVAVSSRRRILDRSRSLVLPTGRNGPLLITGEPGAGKTWIAERLAAELPAGWRSLRTELTASLDAREFLRLIADALGLATTERVGLARLRAQEALENDGVEGRNWLLIVDEAQRASEAVWEEIQVLAGTLGRAGGFAAMVLLGRTELARELAVRRRHAWAARLGAHLHLPPLDLDEAAELLGLSDLSAGGAAALPEFEELHRDALGNPRRLLRLAASRGWPLPARSHMELQDRREKPSAPVPVPARPRQPEETAERSGVAPLDIAPIPSSAAPRSAPAGSSNGTAAGAPPIAGAPAPKPFRPPPLLPSRPPIRLEEGLVEVGWDGELDDDGAAVAGPRGRPDDAATAAPEGPFYGVAPIVDPYADLQARAEWAAHREREREREGGPGPFLAPGRPDNAPALRAEPAPSGRENGRPPAWLPPNVRPEPPHDFAPYGSLFARSHTSRQN